MVLRIFRTFLTVAFNSFSPSMNKFVRSQRTAVSIFSSGSGLWFGYITDFDVIFLLSSTAESFNRNHIPRVSLTTINQSIWIFFASSFFMIIAPFLKLTSKDHFCGICVWLLRDLHCFYTSIWCNLEEFQAFTLSLEFYQWEQWLCCPRAYVCAFVSFKYQKTTVDIPIFQTIKYEGNWIWTNHMDFIFVFDVIVLIYTHSYHSSVMLLDFEGA